MTCILSLNLLKLTLATVTLSFLQEMYTSKIKGVKWIEAQATNKPVLYILGNHEFYGKAYPKLINDFIAVILKMLDVFSY